MIVIGLALLGLVIGAMAAKKRHGNRKDIAQYAVGFAFAFSTVGLIFTALADRILSGG